MTIPALKILPHLVLSYREQLEMKYDILKIIIIVEHLST